MKILGVEHNLKGIHNSTGMIPQGISLDSSSSVGMTGICYYNLKGMHNLAANAFFALQGATHHNLKGSLLLIRE